MRVVVEPTAAGLGSSAARFVSDAIRAAPPLVLTLPTGRTPLGMYSEIVRLHRQEGLDFSRVRIFSLDEYAGISPADPRSFHHYLWRHFLGPVNTPAHNVRLAPSTADAASCKFYEDAIRAAGGIDMLIAGVGSNGHVAFNEPGSPIDSRTRVVRLADSTIGNIRSVFAPGEPPSLAVTIGLATILDARRILLIAAGEAKKQAVQGLLNGCVSVSNPVSLLYGHPDLTVMVDRDAVDECPGPDLSRRLR